MKQKDLAEILNLKANTYSYYEKGDTTPSYSNLIKIASFFNVSIDNLLKVDLAKSLPIIQKEILEPFSAFNSNKKKFDNPIVPIKAKAGYFSTFFQDDKEYIQYIELPFFQSSVQKRTFEIEGDSMIPYFYDGNFVSCEFVDSQSKLISSNYYIIVSRQDGILLKKILLDIERKHYILISENIEYPPIIRRWSEVDEIWSVKYKITKEF